MGVPDQFREKRLLRSHLISVNRNEWGAVKAGSKTEFRSLRVQPIANYKTPTPVLLYARNLAGKWESKMMILERTWIEQLMAISAESIAAEGYASIDEFKRHWSLNHSSSKRFPALRNVRVYRVGPFEPVRAGALLLDAFYGEFL